MSLYDSASLVMIPSGVKEDKLYSIKPTDGSGDFTFSRGSDIQATRVNASGLIEKAKVNLLLQSNTFSTTWVNSTSTETGGQSGYDGTNDAWLLETTGANGRLNQNVTTGVCTLSIYAKAGSLDFLRFQIVGPADANAYYDLANGTIGTTGADAIDTTITSVGSGWYRCTMSAPSATTIRIFPAQADGDTSGTSGNILIQDAALCHGLIAQDYVETTATSVVEGLTADLPRLDYSGGASCPSLLLEPSRTNKNVQSEYFNTWYTLDAQTATANAALSPEGVQNATLIERTSSSGNSRLQTPIITKTSGGSVVHSYFLKAHTANNVILYSTQAGEGKKFDISAGTAGDDFISAPDDYGIEPYADDWYRIWISVTTAGTAAQAWLYIDESDTSGLYLYGGATEEGSYPTSYIPTYGTAANRGADFNDNNDLVDTAISFGANDDFTLFYEGSFDDLSSTFNMIMGGGRYQLGNDYKNYWWVQNASTILIRGFAETNMATATMSITDNTNVKLLVKRSGSVIDFFVNGSKLTTTQQTTNTAFTFRSLGWAYNNPVYKVSGTIKQALVFELALTDAEAIALTTI